MINNPPSKEDISQSIKGLLLKQARETKGLSLETVHEQTKIPVDVLKGIEDGYKIRTVSSFYLKAFVKIYAQYLDVDVQQVMEGYHKEELPKYVKVDVEDSTASQWVSRIFTRERKQKLVLGATIVLGLILVFKFISFVVHKKNQGNSIKRELPIVEKKAKSKKENKHKKQDAEEDKSAKSEESSSEEKNTSQAASSEEKKVYKDVTLVVRAKAKSWLRVKADGQVVFQSTLKTGSFETWTAKDKIEISGRNISQLEFELNGKLIGSLGREDRQAKTIVITKNGLSVTK
ncbi:MAG: DUF4115 domain-containing protein [Candidatus Omnitrophica bacterium]|nr:DUF4115 domain-containing protein [Candidatus Omnitrophota bacterium]